MAGSLTCARPWGNALKGRSCRQTRILYLMVDLFRSWVIEERLSNKLFTFSTSFYRLTHYTNQGVQYE